MVVILPWVKENAVVALICISEMWVVREKLKEAEVRIQHDRFISKPTEKTTLGFRSDQPCPCRLQRPLEVREYHRKGCRKK